jgi:C-terminal processing protease CtpA/Prc
MTLVTEDPYTVFFPPLESDSFDEMYNGSYEGIGAVMENSDS